jgi:hypothetical protein
MSIDSVSIEYNLVYQASATFAQPLTTLRSHSDDKAVAIVNGMANVVWVELVTLIASKTSDQNADLRYLPLVTSC